MDWVGRRPICRTDEQMHVEACSILQHAAVGTFSIWLVVGSLAD